MASWKFPLGVSTWLLMLIAKKRISLTPTTITLNLWEDAFPFMSIGSPLQANFPFRKQVFVLIFLSVGRQRISQCPSKNPHYMTFLLHFFFIPLKHLKAFGCRFKPIDKESLLKKNNIICFLMEKSPHSMLWRLDMMKKMGGWRMDCLVYETVSAQLSITINVIHLIYWNWSQTSCPTRQSTLSLSLEPQCTLTHHYRFKHHTYNYENQNNIDKRGTDPNTF